MRTGMRPQVKYQRLKSHMGDYQLEASTPGGRPPEYDNPAYQVGVRGPFGIRRFPLIVIYADTESIATKIFENANSPEALLHPCNYSKQSK